MNNEEAKCDQYAIYNRVIKEGKFLKENDYVKGFGMNFSHYSRVKKEREKRNIDKINYRPSYDHECRNNKYRIDGTLIKSVYHKLHDYYLVKKETNEKYCIDVVSVCYHYGLFLSLMTRKVGSKSHGQVIWEIIKGCDNETIEEVKMNKQDYYLLKR